jgi:hypothetical protein
MRTSDRDELDSLYEAGLAAVMRAIAVP